MRDRAQHLGFFDAVRVIVVAFGRHPSAQEATDLICRLPLEAPQVPPEHRPLWLVEEARSRVGVAALDVANLTRGRRFFAYLRLIYAQVYLRAIVRMLLATTKLRIDP